jgi:nucleoside 2-deoxyribosyltransferase
MFIYEIGCLTKYHRDNEFHKGLDWRIELDDFAMDNQIETYNPAITFMKEINHTYNPRLCVDQNDYYIQKCDIAVANLDDIESSPGSIYELVRFKELRKPIIAFGSKHWSPHINSCISHQCDTLEEVIKLLCMMFDQGNFCIQTNIKYI